MGCAGALIAYYVTERRGRIANLFSGERNAGRRFVFDAFLYLASGGIIVAWVVRPSNEAGAVIAGAGWEAIFNRFRPDRRFPA